jgi:diguanylate cyclase (GGDEF)-like protein
MGYSGPAGEAVASLVSQTGEPLLRADLMACSDGDLFEDERLLRNTGIRSTAILPLTVQGRTIGTVNLASSRVGAFTPAEVSAVRALAPVVAAAIENARLYRSLQVAQQEVEEAHREEFDRARHDPLTGLPNRRRLSEDLTTMRARARRYGAAHGCSIAMIDVDYFKQYNDRYGHLAGDQVLTRVADALQSQVRSGDVVYRYGGEEFVALLVEADPAAATAVAHRLRQCVERLGIVHEARPEPAIVTCSIGVAALCIAEDEDAGMLADADAMLYRAKNAGRNRVVS